MCSINIVNFWQHCLAEISKQHYLSKLIFTHCNDIHFWFNEKKPIFRALIYPDVVCIAPETVEPWLLEEEGVITAGTQCDTLSGSLAMKCSCLIVLRPEEACPSLHFAPRNHTGISCGLRSFTALYIIFICLPGIYSTQQLYYTFNIFLPHESIFLCFHLIYLKKIFPNYTRLSNSPSDLK